MTLLCMHPLRQVSTAGGGCACLFCRRKICRKHKKGLAIQNAANSGTAALQQVYQRSLKVVQQLLPRPHLRTGPLLASAPSTQRTPHERHALPLRPVYNGPEGVQCRRVDAL